MVKSTWYKTGIAWLLLAMFALPIAVKATHSYRSCMFETHADNSHSQHDCNTCLICKFAFTPFTGNTCCDYDFSVIPNTAQQDVFYSKKPYTIFPVSYGLRAPPAA